MSRKPTRIWLSVLAAAIGVLPAAPHAQVRNVLPGPRDVTVAAIDGVVAAGATWERVWHGTDNADGIVPASDDGVLFAQEQPRRIGHVNAAGEYRVFLQGTRGVGSLSVDREGNLWGVERSCTDPGGQSPGECAEPTAIARLTPERAELANAFADGRPLGRLNDLIVDRRGGVYFTVGGVYYADSDGRATSLGDDLRTNGVMLSPDETTLYVTNRETVVAFDVSPDGAVTNRHDFARLQAGGVGDGLAIDGEARLYVTSAPGIQVFAATGRYLGLIPTPRNVISATFAGPGKRWLYVVGSGAALGPRGGEYRTPDGVRNNAKTIYRIRLIAQGFLGRPK